MFLLTLCFTYSYLQGIYFRFYAAPATETAESLLARLPQAPKSDGSAPEQLVQLAPLADCLGLHAAADAVRGNFIALAPPANPHPEGWIGVDLDGTLARFDRFESADHIEANPQPEMLRLALRVTTPAAHTQPVPRYPPRRLH